MDALATVARIDVNRGLRDRLDRNRASGTSASQAAELTIAVNDMQDLARSRFATRPGDPQH